MHRRHPHYRLGDPETITGDFTTPAAPAAPLAPRAAGGGFLTPKTGGTMIGAGLLLGLGVVGYYVYKGGSLTDLWSKLTASEKEEEVPASSKPEDSRTFARGVLAPLPSGVASYIPKNLPSGRGGTGAGSVYRPAVDMY